MTLAEARAVCAELEILPWDDVAIADAISATTAQLVRASPQVSPVAGAPGMWWVGASGFGRNAEYESSVDATPRPAFRVPRPELDLGRLLQRIASAWHPQSRVAIAGTCVAARAATWAGASFGRPADARPLLNIVPPGEDAAYLATAPLTLLPMDAEMRDALSALGVRTVGGFADLDAGDVEQRWGDLGLAAWRLAHGDDPRRPVLARVDDPPHVELELAAPAADMEPVLFLVRPALDRLVAQLVAESRAIACLAVTLTLDDARGPLPTARAHTVTREIRLPRALARVAPLVERCRGLLSRWELSAPVTALRLTVQLTAPLTGEQGNLLDTSWRDPGAADAALERVRSELGPDVVVKPQARDGYAPERSGQWSGATELQAEGGRPKAEDRSTGSGLRPSVFSHQPAVLDSLRLLHPAEHIAVDRPSTDSPPRRITWRGRAITVRFAAGPERLAGDWWNDGFTRDYWRCESADDTGELLLYHDAAGWWMQGWYD